MPAYDIKEISKEAKIIYYDALKKMRENEENQILIQLRNYKYKEPNLDFSKVKEDFDIEIKMIDDAKNYYFKKKGKTNDTVVLMLHGGGYVLPVSQNNIIGAH